MVLEGRSQMIQVLLFLREASRATLSEVQRVLAKGRYRAQYSWTLGVLNEMKAMDLVREEVVQLRRVRVRLYELTPLGREVAEILARMFSLGR